jgi:hypothetical protein
MTVQELLNAYNEFAALMDDPDLTPEDEAMAVEGMEIAESQLDALGYDFTGTPYSEPEYENRAYLDALPSALSCPALPAA